MPKQQSKKAGGSPKIGRNLTKCARYKSEHRREKNKARKAVKQVKIEANHRMKKERRGTFNG